MQQNIEERRKVLKDVIRRLHEGVPAKKLEKDFRKVIKQSSAEEIAGIEQSLIDEGFPGIRYTPISWKTRRRDGRPSVSLQRPRG